MESKQSKLKIEHGTNETFVTINESKLLDDESIKEIENTLLKIVDASRHSKMLLNFSEVDFLSSSFLGCLVKILKRTREKDGELVLINIAPHLLKIFTITQLDKIFDIA